MGLLMRPGSTLLLAGVAAYFLSRVIGAVPLVGGLLTFILFFFSIFAVIGGIWLTIAGRGR